MSAIDDYAERYDPRIKDILKECSVLAEDIRGNDNLGTYATAIGIILVQKLRFALGEDIGNPELKKEDRDNLELIIGGKQDEMPPEHITNMPGAIGSYQVYWHLANPDSTEVVGNVFKAPHLPIFEGFDSFHFEDFIQSYINWLDRITEIKNESPMHIPIYGNILLGAMYIGYGMHQSEVSANILAFNQRYCANNGLQ